MAWLVRGLLVLAGIVASWWIAEDEPIFPVVQMVVVLLLIVLALLVVEVWLPRWREKSAARKAP
jgi:membrane protein DedA with SNARE-associated domain